MAKRRCARCPKLIDVDSYRGLCLDCRRRREAERGSKAQRGYGADYQAEKAQWQARIDAGDDVRCWRPACRRSITGRRWHLGHDDHDRTVIRGPECERCNLSAAGRASHGLDRS